MTFFSQSEVILDDFVGGDLFGKPKNCGIHLIYQLNSFGVVQFCLFLDIFTPETKTTLIDPI